MPKLRHYETGDIRFVTFSTDQKRPVFHDQHLANIFLDHLERACIDGMLNVYAFVVMPDHVHLLCRPTGPMPLSKVIAEIKSRSAREILPAYREFHNASVERLWKPRFFDFNCINRDRAIEKMRYIHQNPVRAGLCRDSEEYPYSSASWYLEMRVGLITLTQLEE